MATVAYAAKRLKLRTQRDRTARADTSPCVFSDPVIFQREVRFCTRSCPVLLRHMRDMTKDECKSLQVIAAAFANRGKLCAPERWRSVGSVGDLFQ
jgi:hypothetical protein